MSLPQTQNANANDISTVIATLASRQAQREKTEPLSGPRRAAVMMLALYGMPKMGLPILPTVKGLVLAILTGMVTYSLVIGALFFREIRSGLRDWRARHG